MQQRKLARSRIFFFSASVNGGMSWHAASGGRVSHHHKILDYLESYHGGTGRTRGARTLHDGKSLIFPMRSGKPRSMSTLRKILRHHRIAAVAHGFRSSLRDWAAEETDHPREVIEVVLAHVVPDKVEAAYAWSDPFERRCRPWPTSAATAPAVSSARRSMALRSSSATSGALGSCGRSGLPRQSGTAFTTRSAGTRRVRVPILMPYSPDFRFRRGTLPRRTSVEPCFSGL